MAEITPMMRQYLEMKERYPDSILFFRLGDFYEMFNEDAKLVSRELDLTLTTRDRNKPPEERTPMCGVPYHSCESYIARLIAKGYKVAICEQTEDPAQAKGLVDRDIIRIITPGTLIDSSMLEEGKNNYIGGVYADSRALGLCLCDISTGEFYVTSFPAGAEAMDHLKNELGRFSPREAVLSDGAWSLEGLPQFLRERLDCRCENGGEARFRYEAALPLVQKQFRTGLDSLPPEDQACVQCAGGLLSYLYETQKTDLSHIAALTCYTAGQFMELDLNARQTLELTETLRGKEKKGSLLWVLDKTRTAMGRRLIRGWMERPLLSPVQINRRQQAVSDLVEDIITREEVVLCLKEITDLERLIGRVVYGTAGGRDLAALSAGLGRLPRLRELLEGCPSALIRSLRREMDDLPQLRALLSSALVVWQSDALSRIFSPDPAVIAASARYLQCVMPPYVLFSTLFVLNSAMRGAGDSLYPMFNVVASVILLRVPFLYLLADRFGPDYMYWSYGIGWAVACVLSVYHYVSGKWRGKYREV